MNKNNKLYKIGEVSEKLRIPAYVLRFWETEFPELSPFKTPKGQRLYSEKDMEIIQNIAHLRYEEKLTLDGAKQKMTVSRSSDIHPDLKNSLLKIKKGLQEILAVLR